MNLFELLFGFKRQIDELQEKVSDLRHEKSELQGRLEETQAENVGLTIQRSNLEKICAQYRADISSAGHQLNYERSARRKLAINADLERSREACEHLVLCARDLKQAIVNHRSAGCRIEEGTLSLFNMV